jgi:drug/metabolite transporter (DMT)-like permease
VSQAPARVWLAFAAVVIAWGSSYLFIRLAIGSFTPFGLVATRFFAAAVLCAVIGLLRKERFPRGREVGRLGLLGVMMMSGSNALTAYAQATVASGITSVFHSLSAVYLAALGKEKLTGTVWVGVFGGVAGVALLLWPGETRVDVLGASALLLASWIFTVASLLQRKWQTGESGPGLFSSLAVQMGSGGLLSALIATAGPGFTHAPLTVSSLGGVLWLTVVSSCGGFAGYAIVLRHWTPARAGSFAVVNPVVSVLLGVLLLDEPFTLRMAAGVGVTLAAVAWVQLRLGRTA